MPKVLDALLICRKCARPTLHLFHERRDQVKPGPAAAGPIFVDLIYVCDACETGRVWGSEPVTAPGWASEQDAREDHATLVHGMREVECPVCHGFGFGCSECSDKGEIWEWDNPNPCGPDCPLRRPERR